MPQAKDMLPADDDFAHYYSATIRQRQRAERAEFKLKQIRDILNAPWEGESCADRLDHIESILDA